MIPWLWPTELRPTGQAFYIETMTARFAGTSRNVSIGERFPVALNTPPSSIGRTTAVALFFW